VAFAASSQLNKDSHAIRHARLSVGTRQSARRR
jgi:hypothetical protein